MKKYITCLLFVLMAFVYPACAGGYYKSGAGIKLLSSAEVQLQPGEEREIEIRFSNPSKVGTLHLSVLSAKGLSVVSSDASWVFENGEKPVVNLRLTGERSGRYYLMFNAENTTEGFTSASVVGLTVQVGEPAIKIQKTESIGGTQSLPAKESITNQ